MNIINVKDNSSSYSPFQLIQIQVGNDILYARPVDFNTDVNLQDGTGKLKDGTYMMPTKFAMTCPKCTQLLEFSPVDIYSVNGKILCVDCQCGLTTKGTRLAGSALLHAVKTINLDIYMAIEAFNNANKKDAKPIHKSAAAMISNIFFDPIETGVLKFDGAVRLGV